LTHSFLENIHTGECPAHAPINAILIKSFAFH